MKRLNILILIFLCVFTACSNQKRHVSVLLDDFTIPNEGHPEWTTLFSDNYEITPLETTSECLIGQIDKIKKFKKHYYVSSSNGQSILHFDERGKFVSALSKQGQGPAEYHRIEDFDVYEIKGKTEVWISDNRNLKIYDANDFSFKYKIPYSFVIHKFKRLENSHVLLVTGQNENILTVTDKEGNVISEYLKKEIPYIMFRPVQFIVFGSNILFQLGISNSYVLFNPETETFQKGVFTNETSYLTEAQLLELFNNYGIDFIMEANKGSYINNLVTKHDTIWIQTYNAGKKYLTKFQAGCMVSTEFSYGSVLATFSVGDSDDSVLLFINPDQFLSYKKDVFDKFGNKISLGIEDNPCILEFF